MHTRRYLFPFGLLVAASLSACCCDDRKTAANAGEDKSAPAETASVKRTGASPLTSGRYCRLDVSGKKRPWTIVPAKLQDFVTAGTVSIDFHIPTGRAHVNYKNTRIEINELDSFEFDAVVGDPDTVKMTHKSITGNKYETYIANTSSKENLWFEGIHVASNGSVLGTYFVYRMPPNKPCTHPKSVNTTNKQPCPGALVEFFDTKDLNAYAQRPVLGTNVFPSTALQCPAPESSEGDGDEGPR